MYFYDFLTYYLINMISLYGHDRALVYAFSIIYFIICVFVLYYAIVATKADVADPTIYAHRRAKAFK